MWHVRKTHFSVRRRKKVEVRKKNPQMNWMISWGQSWRCSSLARQIDALFSHLHNHSHHQNKYSQWERNPEFTKRERGGTLEKQKAMCRKIMKGQPSTYTKACRRISWNLLPVTLRQQWTTFGQRHCCGDILPTLFLQVFSQCSSACALTEEDSRAELSDILCGSVNVKGGA